MRTSDLIREMGRNMGIFKADLESVEQYADRVIYSACSAWYRAAIWEEDGNPSVQGVKQRMRKKLEACVSMCDDLIHLANEDIRERLIDQAYTLHLKTGTVYHSAYHLKPAPDKTCTKDGICYFRRGNPSAWYDYSGLGIFEMTKGKPNQGDLFEIYGLDSIKSEEISEYSLKSRQWQPLPSIGDLEYLNVTRKRYDGYFSKENKASTPYTLGRKNTEGRPSYYLIRADKSSELADWEIGAGLQRHLAIAIYEKHQPLIADVHRDGELTFIKCNFFLPAADETFLCFWSWPEDLTHMENMWNYVVPRPLQKVVFDRLIFLGYELKEN